MITVLTPTFNRIHTLPRLYESLLRQTCRDFEWLVVDDGSQDSTREWVTGLIEQGDMHIRYVFQPNAGKHIALNTGAGQAHGDVILIVDSDDSLVDSAIQQIQDKYALYGRGNVNGLCFRKALLNGKLVGRTVLADVVELTPTEAGKTFQGDLAYVFTKAAMTSNPFPQIAGEKFVPELYIWNKIGDSGRIVFFPQQVIYLCEYLPDGYTHNFMSTLKKNPRGFLLFYADQIGRETSLVLKLKYAIRSLQCCYFQVIKQHRRNPPQANH